MLKVRILLTLAAGALICFTEYVQTKLILGGVLVFIGLTGGMGCGKSVACALFAEMDWLILNADEICHSLYNEKEGQLLDLLCERWGNDVIKPDGTGLDCGKVSDIIFNSLEERDWLNARIHPMVLQKALDVYAANPANNIMFDVPLLFEAGWCDRFDAVIAIWTEDIVRRARLRERGMTDQDITRRDAAQMSIEKKMELADYTLINNGSIEKLRAQCEIVSNTLKHKNGKGTILCLLDKKNQPWKIQVRK